MIRVAYTHQLKRSWTIGGHPETLFDGARAQNPIVSITCREIPFAGIEFVFFKTLEIHR